MGFILPPDRAIARAVSEFRIDCSCGQRVTVTEGDAGGTLPCPCGRTVRVPSLHELRTQAGLTPYDLSPELVIENLLAAGKLPPTKTCVCCSKETDEILRVVTECERSWVRWTGGVTWAHLLAMILLPIWLWERTERHEFGKDKIYSLPIPICLGCRPILRDTRSIKQALRKIPDYARLLDKFPKAKVRA
jgi:hypothetical protein